MRKLLALLLSVILCASVIPAALAEQDAGTDKPEATIVPFGTYPQTADGTDKTPIEWYVLDYREDEGRALLLSRNVLDAVSFNGKAGQVTWEECALRAWLNDEFLNTAFTEEEKALILQTRVLNGENQNYQAGYALIGKDTKDLVFLLSYAEARDCLGVAGEEPALDNMYSRAYPTEYALARGVPQTTWKWSGDTVAWWLRTPDITSNAYSSVEGDGSVGYHYVEDAKVGLRPAIWVITDPEKSRNYDDRAEKVLEYSTIGNVVKYGHYMQYNTSTKDPEEIEWIVLDVYENKALLISKYGLDSKVYQEEDFYGETTWENSYIRKWLQEKFLPEAFTKEEQAAIVKAKVNNGRKHVKKWKTNGGNNTKDKIFLLSYAEAEKYQEIIWQNTYNTKAGVILTAYAYLHGAVPSNRYYIDLKTRKVYPGWWWLRTPGEQQNCAAVVEANGDLGDRYMDNKGGAIRPALWLDLDKVPFD